jgi:predicted Zn-dependent peptidase
MEHVRAVTLDDVQSLAAEWFTPAHASAALLAPDVSSGDGEAVDAILAGL